MTEWQRVSETLVDEIERGIIAADERLPADTELAVRFGVHKHTVRRALTDLQARGIVRSERGRGTFVVRDAIAYRLGAQIRFEESLAENRLAATRRLLSVAQFGAPGDIAQHLQIAPGEPVLMVTMLGEADETPAQLVTLWFALDRTPAVKSLFENLPVDTPIELSLDSVMRHAGINSFRRKSARLECRLPELEEARHLKIARHDPIFEAEIPNIDDKGTVVYYSVTLYPGSRTAFVFDY
ncbi:phosphonate metabolism transcriptional regulator PhnF [Paraburkholderia phenoliruptrix]|uniref:phosphonate metabolism transcriptional regulator PhnF n=1 Tax=Paraburkholderia phenoliruptrix TaxID=252970 RepID=UPI00286994BF|nr:phosphonate metabolism transcriptional regulator PhnF [Paraburkholderia phenoliruptrix]WMY10991.1 phosphonate metabolism transcriptional regulator PhnF [Paraburkholderia phenoliruptrix]